MNTDDALMVAETYYTRLVNEGTSAAVARSRVLRELHNFDNAILDQVVERLLSKFPNMEERWEQIVPGRASETSQFKPELGSLIQSGIIGSRVLDHGAGHLRNARKLQDEGYGVVAFDFSRPSLILGMQSEQFKLETGGLCQANMVALPYLDNSFDAVVSYGVLQQGVAPKTLDGSFIQNAQHAFAEISRVLRPGGYFSFTFRSFWQMPDEFNTIRQTYFRPYRFLLEGSRYSDPDDLVRTTATINDDQSLRRQWINGQAGIINGPTYTANIDNGLMFHYWTDIEIMESAAAGQLKSPSREDIKGLVDSGYFGNYDGIVVQTPKDVENLLREPFVVKRTENGLWEYVGIFQKAT